MPAILPRVEENLVLEPLSPESPARAIEHLSHDNTDWQRDAILLFKGHDMKDDEIEGKLRAALAKAGGDKAHAIEMLTHELSPAELERVQKFVAEKVITEHDADRPEADTLKEPRVVAESGGDQRWFVTCRGCRRAYDFAIPTRPHSSLGAYDSKCPGCGRLYDVGSESPKAP
jgi:hypothetical protein